MDLAAYEREVTERLGPGRDLMSRVVVRARRNPGRILYPEGEHPNALRAARAVARERIAQPVLVGKAEEIRRSAEHHGISLGGVEIVDPVTDHRAPALAEELCRIRSHRSQVTIEEARERLEDATWFSSMLLQGEYADGMVCGVTKAVRKTIQPILKVIPLRPGFRLACGLSVVVTGQRVLFLADTAVNIEPSAEDLSDIALLADILGGLLVQSSPELGNVPSALNACRGLRHLTLITCGLTQCPALEHWPDLRVLALYGNDLKALDPALGKLSHLTTLNVVTLSTT